MTSLITEMARDARDAYRQLAKASTEAKNHALRAAAASLRNAQAEILTANQKDMDAAKDAAPAFQDRLKLNASRIEGIAAGLEAIAQLPDPVGRVLTAWDRPNGLQMSRVAVPLGVIGIIYEARPNVTADAGALCLKSGNACILRGGSDSLHSSLAIAACLQAGLREAGLPEKAIQLVPSADREHVGSMLTANGLIDVIVPRGGKSLTERVQRDSRVPTLLHLDGNCHSYVHASANTEMAARVVANAKMRRTGICGATESLLIDRGALQKLPAILDALFEKGLKEARGDEASRQVDSRIVPATPTDWDTEYLDAIIAVKVVDGVEEAIDHINRHGSHHTDAIIAEDDASAEAFLAGVDSAIVVRNASTQYADGGEFGFGAEIGIATGRLHARGPVGLEQLCTYKYRVIGDGHTRP